MIRDDMHCYRGILAIDIGFSYKNGTGFVIFNETNFRLKSCRLLRPFAPGLESLVAIDEMRPKVKEAWEQEVGFSYDPLRLIIEFPKIYLNYINQTPLARLACLAGMIRASFKIPIERVLMPHASDWKGNKSKNQTMEEVKNRLDNIDKNCLIKNLSSIPQMLHHNIYDAIGLGFWAIDSVIKK